MKEELDPVEGKKNFLNSKSTPSKFLRAIL